MTTDSTTKSVSSSDAKLLEINESDLEFDPENPRLPKRLQRAPETEVLGWMLEDASLPLLMGSIAAEGFFRGEPLLVVPAPTPQSTRNRFRVVEGNRRLAAVRLLAHPELAPKKKDTVNSITKEAKHTPTNLPCISFGSRAEILRYLGYRHITGIKEWEPAAKARYLKQLYEQSGDSVRDKKLREVARAIGSRSDYVARLLTALALYDRLEGNNFFDLPNVSEVNFAFSLLTVALNHAGTTNFIGLSSADDFSLEGISETALKDLSLWLFSEVKETRRTILGESRNMKKLAAVVQSRAALKSLRSGDSLEVAYQLVNGPEAALSFHLQSASDDLSRAVDVRSKNNLTLGTSDRTKIEAIERSVERLSKKSSGKERA
jgi:hypothetical protein